MPGIDFDPDFYAKGMVAAQPDKGLVMPAIKSGVESAAGQLSSAVRAVGDLTGSSTLSDLGQRGEVVSNQKAAEFANPAYEGANPFSGGIGHAVGWAIYNTLKAAPQFAAAGLGAMAAPEAEAAVIGTRAAELGAKAGEVSTLGHTAAAALGMLPFTVGQSYQATEQTPGGQGDAGRALMMAPGLATIQSWVPGGVAKLLETGGGMVKNALVSGAHQAVAMGAATAITDLANPNLSTRDRIGNIVDAAMGGALMGGIMGGAGAAAGNLKRADPASVTTEQLGNVVDQALNPETGAGQPAAALPSPSMFTDSAGRTAAGTAGMGDIMATPRDTGMSPTDRMVADATIPQAPPAIESSTVIQDKQGSLRWAKPYEQDDTSRPFRNLTDPELQNAQAVLQAKGDDLKPEHAQILQMVQDEIANRSTNQPLNNSDVQQAAGAVDRTGDANRGVANQGSAGPAPANDFQSQLDDWKKGSNTAWGRQVDATDPLDLATKVAERLESHPSPSLTEFATRIGLLDPKDPNKVTPLAAAVEQAKAGTEGKASLAANDQPDPDFQKQWAQDLANKQGLAVKDFRENPPANEAEAKQRIYDMLGNPPEGDAASTKDGYSTVVDLAKKYGLLDKDGRYTEAGLDIAKSRVTQADAVEEAQKRQVPVEDGSNATRPYDGAEVSAFDDGARGIERTKFDSLKDMAAYSEGQKWGEDQRNGAGLHPGSSESDTRDVLRGLLGGRNPDFEQQRQQALNQQIDKVYGATTRPEELAKLKGMVRKGASNAEIDKAAAELASARGNRETPPPSPSKPFKGEIVDRGAPRTGNINDAALTPDERARVAQQLKDRHEQSKDLLRDEIQGARLSGDITPVDAIRMHHLLTLNDLQGVKDRLPGGRLHSAGEVPTGDFMNRLAETAVPGHEQTAPERTVASPALRLKLMSGDIRGSLQEIANNSKSPMYRLIARKLDGDWTKDVTLSREAYDPQRTGRAILNENGQSTVQLFGDQGMNEETFLHEMIHALVHRRWMGDPGSDPLAQRINELHDQIRGAIEKAYPELTKNAVWADQVAYRPDEMITWAMTNPEAQEMLKRIDINGNKIEESKPGSLWDQFKGLISDLLGIPSNGRAMSALDHILQAGHAVLDQKEQIDAAAHVPVPQVNDRLTAAVGLAAKEAPAKINELLDRTSAKEKTFGALLSTMHGTHLVEKYGLREKTLPELVDWQNVNLQSNGIRNTIAKIGVEATDRMTRLQKGSEADRAMADRVNEMALAAASGYNPVLPWDKQTWLHKDPQAGLLKQYVDRAYRNAQAVRMAGHMPVYEGLKNLLETVGLVHMHERLDILMRTDPTLRAAAETIGDPITDFVKATDKHTPELAVQHFRDTLEQTMSTLEDHFKAIRGDAHLTEDQVRQAEIGMSRMEAEIQTIRDQMGATRQTPYFHLYREGDHMVAAKLATLEDGRANPASVRAAAVELEKAGFTDVKVSPDLSNPHIFLSLDNKAQREIAQGIMERLAQRGHVDMDSILAGPKAKEALLNDGSKSNMQYVMAQVAADPIFSTEGKTPEEAKVIEGQKAAVLETMHQAWLNALPGNALSRVMAHRRTVQGFEKDMLNSTVNRAMVGISAAARMWARPRMNDVMTAMEARRVNALHVTDPQHNKVDTISALVNNIRQRDVAQAAGDRHDWTDTARTISNVFHLGASPAMVLVDGSQLGVLVLPHLGARHGFANAFSAMARAAPTTFRVVREALKQGWNVSALRAAEGNITHNVLRAAIPDKETRDFVEHLIATGAIDIGSHVRSLIDAGTGANPKMQKMLHYAAAMEQYTEVASRMITALATRDLHARSGMKGPVEEYALRTLNDTLGQYTAGNAPPILSKKGPLGKFGPMLLQFKNFEINLMWKLYREFHTAFRDKATSDEERAQARKFLAGHAMMVTALAGTLGLPFAGAMAGAVDKLKDELFPSEHPFDANATVRNYLADIFGKEMGEVIAKGVPRSLGFDMSGRVGEEELMPLTQLLTSRETWSDTLEQWQAQAVGAPASMVADTLRGLDQIHNGNVMGGMATMMPTVIRNPMRAYQMTERGYVDSNGTPLPIESPTAKDVLVQLLGLTPEQKAAYNDDKEIQMETKASLTRTSNAYKAEILRSMMTGDMGGARSVIQKAQAFDQANPSYAVLPRIEAELLARQRGEQVSADIKAPMGVNPKDMYGRGLTGYSTVDYQAQ